MTGLRAAGARLRIGGGKLRTTGGGGSSPPVAPGQVGSFAMGAVTSTTIAVSYTAASGTAPITYAGWYRAHSIGVWMLDSGAFGPTGGAFVGLSPSTSYDLRIVATNAAGTSTTDLLVGVSTSAAPSYPAPSTATTKYFATADKSVVAPGASTTVTIEFNGVPPSSGIITPSTSATGSFSPASVALDGSATKTFTYTPSGSAVEHNLTFTNTANLYDSAPVPLNVFATSAGAAQTIGVTLLLGDQAVHQRDTPSGQPTGFTTANTSGWGEVWVTVAQAAPALFARLYNRRSSGASTAVSSGTELTSGWVQVYGAVTAGQLVRLLLPAIRAKQLYLDLASDSAGTTPTRVANCFAVGTVLIGFTRSQHDGHVRGYAMYASEGVIPNVPWDWTSVSFAADSRYADTSGTWYRHDGTLYGDPTSYSSKVYGENTSNAAMEDGRLIDQQTGTMLGIAGTFTIGGGWDEYIDINTGAVLSTTIDTVMAACRGKARYFLASCTAIDNTTETEAIDRNINDMLPAWVMQHYPTVAVVGIAWASGIFGVDGSRTCGYTRNQVYVTAKEAALPHVASLGDFHWNRFKTGHPAGGCRVVWAREHMRHLLVAERASWGGLQTPNRGPTLGTAATLSGNIIRLPYKLNGATALSSVRIGYPDDGTFTTTASGITASDLASLVAIYPAGGRSGDGSTPLPITGVVVNTVSPPSGYDGTLDVTLSGSGPFASTLAAHFAADFGVSGGTGLDSNATFCTVLTDNLDPFGVGYGQAMRQQLDIVVTA